MRCGIILVISAGGMQPVVGIGGDAQVSAPHLVMLFCSRLPQAS
jgi:hypothetical protein